MILLNAVPPQSEDFGYFIFFGLLLLLFLIGWLFSPKQKALSEVLVKQSGEGGSSFSGCLIAAMVIVIIIMIGFMNAGAPHH